MSSETTLRLFDSATIWLGAQPTAVRGWLCFSDTVVGCGTSDEQPPSGAERVRSHVHVLPSFVDAHSHLSSSAFLPMAHDGARLRTRDDALAAVEGAAAHAHADAWILFLQCDCSSWPGGPPTSRELDDAGAGRPVLLADLSLHCGAASTRALVASGVLERRWRFADDLDRASGEVWEAAFGAVLHVMGKRRLRSGHRSVRSRTRRRATRLRRACP